MNIAHYTFVKYNEMLKTDPINVVDVAPQPWARDQRKV